MSTHGVSVSRLTVNCTVARDHPNIERVRWRLEEAAGAPLRDALAELLDPLARSSREDVLVIRRLELSFDLDASRPVPELARRWAAQLAAQIVLSMDGAGAVVAHFPDRAHYVARFLVDAAAGHAHGKWYYRSFRGLAPLSASAALRTVMLEDFEVGLAALRSLEVGERVLVLQALGPREARRIIETIQVAAGNGDAERAFDAVLAAAPAWRVFARALSSPWLSAVALLALASGARADAPLPALARLAAAVATWIAGEARAERATELGEAPPLLAPLAALAPSRRAQLGAALGRPSDAAALADPVSEYTPFGGLILLLPHVAALPIDDVFSDPAGRALVRLLVLARCAGPARAGRVRSDPVLQRLCGVEDGSAQLEALDDFARALEQRSAGDVGLAAARENTAALAYLGGPEPALTLAALQVMRAFARRLPGFADSSPSHLYENFLAFPATLEHAARGFSCRMGRPPLAALLGITGALRGRIDVPWLGPIELYSGG